MTQDVQQWLTEIQSLQQRLSHVSQERTAAYEQLTRWQRSYQTEAQQRRKDIRRLQTVIYRLDQENKRLKQQLGLPPDARSPLFMSTASGVESGGSSSYLSASQPPSSSEERQTSNPALSSSPPLPPSTIQLQQKCQELIAECDRLSKALSQEQSDHEQTRQTLMTALADTVEQLERERKRQALATSQQTSAQQMLEASATPLAIAPQQSISPAPLPGQPQKKLAAAPPLSPDPDPT